MSTRLDATAGFVLDVARGATSGKLTADEKTLLRDLAGQVAEIAALPCQAEKRELWFKHNRLEKTRPLMLVFPEDSWTEIMPADQLQVRDPFWKQWEWHLRHLIYRHRNYPDDFVIEPYLYINLVMQRSGWGVEAQYHTSGQDKGSYAWEPPIKDEKDLKKLKYPDFEVDEAATQKQVDALKEILGDLLEVRVHCALPMMAVIDSASNLRGIEQIMWDMYDRPQWLHELMDFVSEGISRMAKKLETGGHLTLNNYGHYNDAGGIGYSTELPAPGFDGRRVRFRDLWGYGVAQAASEIGPAQHEEFILRYDLKLLDQCGLNAYGCCEPYTHKFQMLKKNVPRLRRVSVSPWCDIETTAAELDDKYIFSWKPNPAMIVGKFSPERIRRYIRRTLEVARGCVVEMIHKDTFTVEKQPERLVTWARIAREEIERIAG